MEETARCLVCAKTSAEAPLITVTYQDDTYYICPQDLPILIHKPAKLADKLPGVENLGESAEGHHH